MIYGIDIGAYTKKVDWGLLKESGVEFAMIKATQGDYMVNKYFPAMAAEAAAAGMVVGLYHWCDPLRDGKRQAAYFASKTKSIPFHFAAVDIEQEWADWNEWPNRVTKLLKPDTISACGYATTHGVKNGLDGKKVLVYTRASFVHEFAKPMVNWIGEWPLWVAHWAFNAGRVMTTWEDLFRKDPPYTLEPALPRGCREWTFHQWSGDRFVLPGLYDNTVDLNSYNGTLNELRQWAGLPLLQTKEDLLAKLEAETDNFINGAMHLEKALRDYIESVRETKSLSADGGRRLPTQMNADGKI